MYSSIERSRPFLDLDIYWSISSSSLDLLYRLDFIIYWSKSRSSTFRFRSLLPNRKLFLRRPESDLSLKIGAKNFYLPVFGCLKERKFRAGRFSYRCVSCILSRGWPKLDRRKTCRVGRYGL